MPCANSSSRKRFEFTRCFSLPVGSSFCCSPESRPAGSIRRYGSITPTVKLRAQRVFSSIVWLFPPIIAGLSVADTPTTQITFQTVCSGQIHFNSRPCKDKLIGPPSNSAQFGRRALRRLQSIVWPFHRMAIDYWSHLERAGVPATIRSGIIFFRNAIFPDERHRRPLRWKPSSWDYALRRMARAGLQFAEMTIGPTSAYSRGSTGRRSLNFARDSGPVRLHSHPMAAISRLPATNRYCC